MSARRRLGALEEREFRLLFLAQGVTAFGDRMARVAIPFAVLAVTRSPTALGIVLAAGTIPFVVFVLVGGVWADRLSRGAVMVAADLIRGAAQGVTAILLLSGVAEVWHLAALQAVGGMAGAFFFPAAQGLIPDTVSAARLQQANALLGMARNITGIGGPAVAGVLVATAGAGWAVAVDALTFLGSALLLTRLAPTPRRERSAHSFVADLRDGWRAFSTRTWVWASVANFGLFQMIALSTFFVLGPYVAETELGGVGAWATILVAGSIGALAGGTLALRWRPSRPLVAVFVGLAFFAPQYFLLAYAAPVVLIAAVAFACQGSMNLLNSVWFTVLQERIPAEARSRVSSYDWLGSLLFLPVGMALVGPLSTAIGVRTMLILAGAWTVCGSIAMLLVPSIRELRRDQRTPALAGPAPSP